MEHIRIGSNATQEGAPTLHLGWCLTKEGREELQRSAQSEVYALISVFHKKSGHEERNIVSFEPSVDVLDFSKPGEYIVDVIPFWFDPSERSYRKVRRIFLRQDYAGSYRNEIRYRWEPDVISNDFFDIPGVSFLTPASTTVAVDANFFAKEPPRLVSWWVNFGRETKPRDQCAFRRRALFSILWTPLLLALALAWYSFAVIASVVWAFIALLAGVRLSNYPDSGVWLGGIVINRTPKSVWDGDMDSSMFFTCNDGRKRSHRVRLLTPLLWIVGYLFLAFFALLAAANEEAIVSYAEALLSVAKIEAGFYVMFLALVLLSFLVESIMNRTRPERKRRAKERHAEKTSRYIERLQQGVVCSDGAVPTRVSELPRSQRTISLQFKAFKAAVCKPFAR